MLPDCAIESKQLDFSVHEYAENKTSIVTLKKLEFIELIKTMKNAICVRERLKTVLLLTKIFEATEPQGTATHEVGGFGTQQTATD